jgi:hypothetical protein
MSEMRNIWYQNKKDQEMDIQFFQKKKKKKKRQERKGGYMVIE